MNEFGQTLCLNMIVKNEAPVIRRCLDSVRTLIDAWSIVDTGSSDGTQRIIVDHLRDLPGELIERPWKNFGHNRTEALEHARGRGDYVLLIDADETLILPPGFLLPRLISDSYNMEIRFGGQSYLRKQLLRNALPWRYEGVLHEYACCDEARNEQFLPGPYTEPHRDGARAREPLTYRRDALTLEQALLDDPNNTRHVFYLAQSYRDAGDNELALRHYRRRVEMGGWPEEVWCSLYQIAQIEQRMDRPWPEVMQRYLEAFQFKPDRAGPLFRIGVSYQRRREYHLAHLFLERAMAIPMPTTDRLFVEHTLYKYELAIEYAVSCHYVGRQAEAIATNNRLLESGLLPPGLVQLVVRNRQFSLNARAKAPVPLQPAPIRVLVPLHDADHGLDDCIDSLASQDIEGFEVVLLDPGTHEDVRDRIPHGDPRFKVERDEASPSALAAIARFVAGRTDGDDIIVPLRPRDRLASPIALSRIADEFRIHTCSLLWGQHRLGSGMLEKSEPAPDAQAFARGPRLGSAPLCFRARLLHDRTEPGASVDAALWGYAGFEGTRFVDTVLTAESAPSLLGARVDDPPRDRDRLPRALASAPTISCLLVTRDRLSLAKRSIRSFADQTYPHRELVIVTEGETRYRRALERYAAHLGLDRVRVINAPEGATLGRLRNLSLDAATGDVICQWDDDDCSHPDRLMAQAEFMFDQRAFACFFTDHLHFIEPASALLWIDWTLEGQLTDERQFFPGSLMMLKDDRFRYPEEGPFARQGEDSVLLSQLYNSVPVARLAGMGHLYLYQFHGRNTFSKEHHHRIASCCTKIDLLHQHRAKIRSAVEYYSLQKPVVVLGREGAAYALE